MKRKILSAVLVLVGFGCQSAPFGRDAQLPHSAPVWPEPRHRVEVPPAPSEDASGIIGDPIVGFTETGRVVVFDGQNGNVLSTATGGGGTPRDIAVDRWRKGVWVFEENDDASGGEVRFCPLENAFGASNMDNVQLQPCAHAVWIDGLAAMWPTEAGLWIFEYGIGGSRWKILRSGEATPSVSAPRPASIWLENGEIEALSFGFQNDRLQVFRGTFGQTGPEVTQKFDWGKPFGYPPMARYARLGCDAGLLFDALSNTLTVRRVENGEPGLPMTIDVGMPVSRIEAATGLGTSALVLGKDALWIVTTHDADVELMAGLWLHGDVRESPLFFSRDLLVTPSRAFVGTDRGVRAIAMENDGPALVNVYLEEEFVGDELRGPLDALAPDGS
ncbi:MAG TPA: hypothetical protein PK156_22280 [Polyangium sp.]|nr:hypothetical protein [Polyangium sp.]